VRCLHVDAALFLCCTCIVCALFVRCLCVVCAMFVRCLCVVRPVFGRCLCAVCAWLVRCLCVVCAFASLAYLTLCCGKIITTCHGFCLFVLCVCVCVYQMLQIESSLSIIIAFRCCFHFWQPTSCDNGFRTLHSIWSCVRTILFWVFKDDPQFHLDKKTTTMCQKWRKHF